MLQYAAVTRGLTIRAMYAILQRVCNQYEAGLIQLASYRGYFWSKDYGHADLAGVNDLVCAAGTCSSHTWHSGSCSCSLFVKS